VILAIFWCAFGLAAILDVSWSITLFFISLAFGSLAIIPPGVTGGITFLPVTACSFLLAIKTLFKGDGFVSIQDGALHPNRLGLLTAFMVVSLIVTCSAPVLFRGVPVLGFNSSSVSGLTLTPGNITQPLYILASYLVTLSLYQLALDPRTRIAICKAIVIGGIVVVFAGVCDLATAGTSILSPVRTATYAMMNGDSVAGYRRVIGFNTEASSYGSLTLGFLTLVYFLRVGRTIGGRWAMIESPLVLGLLIFTALSTSTAAYLGLVAFVACAFFRNLSARHSKTEINLANLELICLVLAFLAAVVIAILKPSVTDPFTNIINQTLHKGSSSSYEERSMWNVVSLNAFFQTFGYGVGIGSTRASSWPIVVLSSCGALGAGLMLALFVRLCTIRLGTYTGPLHTVTTGARFGLIVASAPSLTVGTVVDFGPINATLFAFAAALPVVLRPPQWLRADWRLNDDPDPLARSMSSLQIGNAL
jgi:hypothetical protein